MRTRGAALLALWLTGCGRVEPAPRSTSAAVQSEPEPGPTDAGAPWSDAWLDAQATAYLDDPQFRRQALLDSLTVKDNIYASTRASAYGQGNTGWDVLPVWNPRSRLVDADTLAALRTEQANALSAALDEAQPLWDGSRPERFAGWVALGREVFYRYPLRAEVYAEHALRDPDVAARVGLQPAADGSWPGTVVFEDVDGIAKIGITCALCHVDVADGRVLEGQAHRDLDYGAMRLAYHDAIGTPLPAELAARMKSWGAGRADITQDDDEDPVAIVDLWGVRDRRFLTQAATLTHEHPAALAIRQETQLLHANRERVRPPRELAWALAMFVYSLEPPARDPLAAAPRGAEVFSRDCEGCHEDSTGSGRPRPATAVGTHASLATGAARGTGLYRPSPLMRVADAAPYFHDGTVATLEDVLDSGRLDSSYQGPRGTGAVPGHRYGLGLNADDRDALLAYLRTL